MCWDDRLTISWAVSKLTTLAAAEFHNLGGLAINHRREKMSTERHICSRGKEALPNHSEQKTINVHGCWLFGQTTNED